MIINKDMNSFNLEYVTRARSLQQQYQEKFSDIESSILKEAGKVKEFTQTYHIWEKNLFQQYIDETEIVLTDIDQLMEDIDNKMDTMTQNILKVKQEITTMIPQTKDQTKKLQQLNSQVAHVEQVLKLGDEAQERHERTKEKYAAENENNKNLVSSMRQLKLVEMVEQSRQIEDLIKTIQNCIALYEQLKLLKEKQIDTADIELQASVQEVSKLTDSISVGVSDEYDVVIKKIQQIGKLLTDSTNVQRSRHETFQSKYIDGEMNQIIGDTDIIYLKKESARCENYIIAMISQKDTTIDEATKIEQQMKQKHKFNNMATQDLLNLKLYLKSLECLLTVNLPKIKQVIDSLEGFALKAIVNRLNNDKKKSQTNIADLKQNYENLQKQIESLNSKLTKVREEFGGLKQKLDSEDMEKDNDFQFQIQDVINECDYDINGTKAVGFNNPLGPTCLQQRKKEIANSINKMVEQFNMVNKLIKESIKIMKSEKEINNLIKMNHQIQSESQGIDVMVDQGQLFADTIDEKLTTLLDPTIPDIRNKYDEKNKLIDKCDELFDRLEEELKVLEANLTGQLKDIAANLKKLQD